MIYHGIEFDQAKLAPLCQRHAVARLALYGSILRDDFRSDSDVDLLVEFKPGARTSLFDLGGMLMELRELLGRDVDLQTPRDLSEYFREQVVSQSKVLYVG